MYQRQPQRSVPTTLPRGGRKLTPTRDIASPGGGRDGPKPRPNPPTDVAKRETELPRKGGYGSGIVVKGDTRPGVEYDTQQPKALARVGTHSWTETIERNDGKQTNISNKNALNAKRKKIAKILNAVDEMEEDYDFSIESNIEDFMSSHLEDISDEDPEAQDLTLLHKAIFQVPEGNSNSEIFTKRRELLRCLLKMEQYRDLFSKERYLITAIKTERRDFVIFVLEEFWDLASVTLEDGKNNTCMHAEFEQLVDCVDLLVCKSGIRNDIVKAQDEKGNTLLHMAVQFRKIWTATISQKHLVEHFLEACPQALTILNKAGQSPYQYHVASSPQDQSSSLDGDQESETISFLLKNHYMRFEQRHDTIKFLYGDNQECEIEFDFRELAGNSYITGDYLSKLSRLFETAAKFESILRYVDLPRLSVEPANEISPSSNSHSSTRNSRQQLDSIVRRNFGEIFDWLYKHGVRKIIKIAVEDDEETPHSDELIETTLRRFGVEVWDWRKFDICSETILEAAPDVKDLWLYSSGNRAVLRSWSGEDGLKKLQSLKHINIFIYQRLESLERTKNNLKEFKTRLQKQCPKVGIKSEIITNSRSKSRMKAPRNPQGGKSVEMTHYWLDCMDSFATFIRNVDVDVKEEVKIAIIDDGVDATHEAIFKNIAGGISYCSWPESVDHTKAYYLLTGSHGTQMASLICRICPVAKLYIARLCEGEGDQGKRQITTASAVKAIKWAIKQRVHIISMSWSLAGDPSNKDLGYLKDAIKEARNKNILMFSSTSDQGNIDDNFYPGSYTDVICIGAAKSTGNKSEWVRSDQAQYLCPGEDVKVEVNSVQDPATGSSIATALAAGLAGLILHCVDIYCADPEIEADKSDLRETLRDLDNMKQVFKNMAGNNNYIRAFEFFNREFRDADWEEKGRKEFMKLMAKLFQKIRQLDVS